MHEDLLRHVWSRQMFDITGLATTDGSPVTVHHPGTLSRISGPDFRQASIEIGGTLYAGDIEFHRRCPDWEAHGHHTDPAYNGVVLHVVLQGDAGPVRSHSGREIPSVVLSSLLPAPIPAIGDHLLREEYRTRNNTIPCAQYNGPITAELLGTLTDTLARERIGEKVRRMRGRLDEILLFLQRTIGEPVSPYPDDLHDLQFLPSAPSGSEYARRDAWEQLLYEEVMDCLGYSNNREAMKTLAERTAVFRLRPLRRKRPIDGTEDQTLAALHTEALLFRVSGLLPEKETISDTAVRVYVHTLTSALQELEALPEGIPMHPSVWNFSPTRPANFPTIRIAAGAEILFRILHRSLFRSVITVMQARTTAPKIILARLTALIDPGEHPFWDTHYSFSEGTFTQHSVLGASRINDILVNSVIPFVCLYASVFGDDAMARRCLNLAEEVPLLEENAVLRIMRNHLIKGKLAITSSYRQQGLLQLYKRYCTQDRCSACRIGHSLLEP